MSDAEALAEIQRLALGWRIRFTTHAETRVEERNISRSEVRRALLTARELRADEERWRVLGSDGVGDDLVVVVVIETDVLVITVF